MPGARIHLPPSDDADRRNTIVKEIAALEGLCNDIELALRANDMPALGRAISDSRRTMHAFENALDAAGPHGDAILDEQLYARLRTIHRVREDQMQRLQAYHQSIGERLQAISRWKIYARSIGSPNTRERKSLLDDRR